MFARDAGPSRSRPQVAYNLPCILDQCTYGPGDAVVLCAQCRKERHPPSTDASDPFARYVVRIYALAAHALCVIDGVDCSAALCSSGFEVRVALREHALR
jgi:hypothetical protein